MRYIMMLSFISIFAIGCKKNDNPVQAFQGGPIVASELSDSVLYVLSISKDTYSIQDTLQGSFSITNNANTMRHFISGDSPIFLWTFKDDTGHLIMGVPAPNHHLTDEFNLNPNESTVFVVNNEIPNIPKGSYTLNAFLYNIGPNLSLLIQIQ